jgi:magnesium chelatase family protein
MSLATLYSRALSGAHAPQVSVEVHVANGLPAFNIVGLPEAEVRESRERVRAALANARFEFPQRRITVNLAPADLPKESGRFDLPIAIGILAATAQVSAKLLGQHEFAGELALNGDLRAVRGALAMALATRRCRRAFIVPAASAAEASLAPDAEILGANTLLEVCAHLCERAPLARWPRLVPDEIREGPDLRDVKGQFQARRALEIAAAGGHSLLMSGPPGTGKTLLATRLPGILPAMLDDEAVESAAILGLVRNFEPAQFATRPFRSPHHSASAAALVGGGSTPRPGEISLAHHGVLFLDELPEFDRDVLEVLREPMESGRITISRAARQCDFPARFQLVAAMNPCPCGYLGHYSGRCRCTPDQIARYRSRISGPLLDRIDLQVEVPALPEADLVCGQQGESSKAVRQRVERARGMQLRRQGLPNAQLAGREIEERAQIDAEGRRLLRDAVSRLGLSARAYHRVLKVARTIADLQQSCEVRSQDVAEALQYRGISASR